MSVENENRRHANVVNVEEVKPFEMEKGSKFGARIRQLGSGTGAHDLGCNHFEVAPGRSAFPRHYHCGIEEAVFVLDGTATLRLGDDTVKIAAGDYITFRAGPDAAHRIDNSGDKPLRYLCISSKANADVVGYPDSNKIGAMASGSRNFRDPPWVRGIFMADNTVEYYDGEESD